LAPAELFAIMIAFKSNEEPENLPQFLDLARGSLNSQEFLRLFSVIRNRLGNDIFTKSLRAVKNLLSNEDFHEIEKICS
jgi:hypothetical protein